MLTHFGEINYKNVPPLEHQRVHEMNHSLQNSANEKEILFAVRVLQTSPTSGRPAMLYGSHNRPAGAAANALFAINQFTPDCAGPIPRRSAGGEVRYLAAIARHEAAAREGLHAARKRGPRNPGAPRAAWSGRARPSCATSARQNWNTDTDY